MGFGGNLGSGVTVQYLSNRPAERTFRNTVHEIGHWLLGRYHPYSASDEANQRTLWGIMGRGNDGICANTYERERLAWINPNVITGDILNAPLLDYVEYGTSYKYHPPNGATNEYYYFENHQKLNIYDNATSNSNDKGIFVLHQQDIYSNINNFRIKTSNGQWNWENPSTASCFGGVTVPSFKTTNVNRTGKNNRDKLAVSGGGYYELFSLIIDGNAVCGDWLNGGGLNNSFNLTYNNVFSPYSNPYTHTWSNTQQDITMEVYAQSGSTLNVKFFLDDPLEGKPSKLQNLQVAVYNTGGDSHPKLTWEANLESDVTGNTTDGYLIERKLDSGSFTQIASVSGTATQYIDYNVHYAGSGPHTAAYKIRAKDTQGEISVYSDTKSINWGDAWKQNAEKRDLIISEYNLLDNYPNPFNPTTQISYSIKEDGFVTLKIYDVIGNEVAVLVNEPRAQGNYSINFNASQLTSGVYIYTIKANDFTASKKMLLTK